MFCPIMITIHEKESANNDPNAMLQEFDRAHNYLQDCFPSIIFYTVQLLAHTVYNEGGVILCVRKPADFQASGIQEGVEV